MSSNQPPTEQVERAGRRAPSGWALRTRLLVGQVLLLALVCVAIGATTELALRHYLTAQLDDTLSEVSDRSVTMASRDPDDPDPRDARQARQRLGPGPEFLDSPGQPVGLVAAAIAPDGTVTAGTLDSDGRRRSLDDATIETLRTTRPGADPHSAALGDRGRYRLIADRAPDGTVIITGLPLAHVNQTLWTVLPIMTVVAIAALAAAAVIGAAITRRALAPLSRMAATAHQVASLPLDRGEVLLPVRVPDATADPNTEVGQMGSALNRMLDHIGTALAARQESETRARQFVADASHELRTPLAAIRGYTELARRRRAEVPDDVAHAMGRVESEAARMTNLVEDLLLLARLDSGRPLERERVDLAELAADAVSDAHVVGPDHAWRLDLPDDPVVVIGDSSRLHQILANLLANARVHTGPGTIVTVRLYTTDTVAVLEVADNGPGIDAELQSEVFNRFARGDTSRSRKAGSTGLGLSIVDAVVRAHDGTIGLRSVPGATVFAIRLPLAGPD